MFSLPMMFPCAGWIVHMLGGIFAALALGLVQQHVFVDANIQFWLKGITKREQEDDKDARREARANMARGAIIVWSPFALLYHFLQSDWAGACLVAAVGCIFWEPVGYNTVVRLSFLVVGVITPARLTAVFLMSLPEAAIWAPCLSSPLVLYIALDSFAQHLALAAWVNAFTLFCISSPAMLVCSIIFHASSLGIRLGMASLHAISLGIMHFTSTGVNTEHAQLGHLQKGMLYTFPLPVALALIPVSLHHCH